MKTRLVLDIEVYYNYFLLGYYINNGSSQKLEIIPEQGIDESSAIRDLLYEAHKNKWEVVTFNGNHYDLPILFFVCDYAGTKNLAYRAKQLSELIISSPDGWWQSSKKLQSYNEATKTLLLSIDLMNYWSSKLRQQKGISLKGLGIQLGYPVVQELPVDPHININEEQIEQIRSYNLQHDLGIMRLLLSSKFYWQGSISSFDGMIALRYAAIQEYNLPSECLSWDSVKLGVNVLLHGINPSVVLSNNNQDIRVKSLIFKHIKFREALCNLIERREESIVYCFKTAYDDLLKKKLKDIQVSYRIIYCGAIFLLKKGGLHTSNKPKVYNSRPGYRLVTFDVSGYYPSIASLLNTPLSNRIAARRDERLALKAKGQGKGDRASLLKLAMNGSIGQMNLEGSRINNPAVFYSITLNGQLMLLMLIEQLYYECHVEVIMANTDGAEMYVSDKYYDKFMEVCKHWQNVSSMELEFDEYQKLIILNVNNYLGILKNGDIKCKGIFVIEKDLGGSSDFKIIAKVLHKHYLEGIPVADAFHVIPFDILDYCGSKKVNKKFKVMWGNELLPQRLNRYFVSNSGKALYKVNEDNKRSAMPGLTGKRITIFNNYYNVTIADVDLSFYISQVNAVVTQLIHQPELF